jgi:sigma-B regulation protein RsbU (phosphoserine phosphatase)
MFVTIFIGVLDLNTGRVRYASAGHNPPVLVRASGGVELLPTRQEPVAGALEGVVYTSDTLDLLPDDTLLLYTDGVTEAMDPRESLYGEQRLLDCSTALTGQDAKGLCQEIAADVHRFASGAEQSDDITLLALRYRGSGANAG